MRILKSWRLEKSSIGRTSTSIRGSGTSAGWSKMPPHSRPDASSLSPQCLLSLALSTLYFETSLSEDHTIPIRSSIGERLHYEQPRTTCDIACLTAEPCPYPAECRDLSLSKSEYRWAWRILLDLPLSRPRGTHRSPSHS